jgi:hypothetical protein
MYINSHVFMVEWLMITDSGLDDWIYWHLLLQSVEVLTINDCLRLAPFLTGLRLSSLQITHFWFTNDGSLTNESRINEFLSASPLIQPGSLQGKCWLLFRIRRNLCWLFVDAETHPVLSRSPRIHLHGNVFCTELFSSNGLHVIYIHIQTTRLTGEGEARCLVHVHKDPTHPSH